MIYKILKKDALEIRRKRNLHGKNVAEKAILFKAANSYWYKQDRVDMIGLKEVEEFKKNVAASVKEQTTLL